MASRNFRRVQSPHRELKVLAGRVLLTTSGAVSSQVGMGATVTKTDTGKYNVAFRDAYPAFLSGDVAILAPSGSAVINAYFSDITVTGTSPSATLYTASGTTIANAVSGTQLHWQFNMLNTDDEV